MTKTESANRTVQAVVIEACEQLLECHMAAGARLAIPNTNNLIMVGPPEWIAKNVPGVEAMVGGTLTDDEILCTLGYVLPDAYGLEVGDADYSAYDIACARTIEREVITRLAANTQASTAQAEQSRPTDLSKRLRAAATAEVSYTDARLLIGAAEEIERYYDGMMAWKKTAEKIGSDWSEARMARENDRCAARADAQAAAEVRDAALVEAIAECDLVLLGVDTPEESVGALNCLAAIRALRAGDTGGAS